MSVACPYNFTYEFTLYIFATTILADVIIDGFKKNKRVLNADTFETIMSSKRKSNRPNKRTLY